MARLRVFVLIAFVAGMGCGIFDGLPLPGSESRTAVSSPQVESEEPAVVASEAPPTASPTPDPFAPPEEGVLILNEVRFLAGEGHPPFVELKNGGLEPVPAQGRLELESGGVFELPSGLGDLAPGEVLLILFDNGPIVQEDGVHGPAGFLEAEAELRLKLGEQLLDRVAWGFDQPGAVRMGRGGVHGEPGPGMSIGRHPFSFRTSPYEWITFSPNQASPGEANPPPGVEVLLPMSGTLIDGAETTLAWYTVPGAVSYQVEVSSDERFEGIVYETAVDQPPVQVGPLPAGRLYWRVRAVYPDQVEAHEAPANLLIVRETGVSGSSGKSARPVMQEATETVLDVPMIYQHKDTGMLFLETSAEEPLFGHPWDGAHEEYAGNDIMDNGNCALASWVMINHYFGGSLSQDRLGYEMFYDLAPGPFQDLMAGQGTRLLWYEFLSRFATGAEVRSRYLELGIERDVMWQEVLAAVDTGRPVPASIPGHAIVIIGYGIEEDGTRTIVFNDPSTGPGRATLEDGEWISYHLLQSTPSNARSDEPEIHRDSDGDGVVDFDETERFGTNPNNRDSDADGLTDLNDIKYWVFDDEHGYGLHFDPSVRDMDGDGRPMEIDPDSDEGGCLDGTENTNSDGFRDADETSNFERDDDRCWKLEILWTWSDSYGATEITMLGNFHVIETEEGDRIVGSGMDRTVHNGPCWPFTVTSPFEFEGEFHDPEPDQVGGETVILRLPQDEAVQEPEINDPDSLSCMVGETIGETIAVAFAAVVPEQIEVTLDSSGAGQTELTTPSEFSARGPGQMVVEIERVEPASGGGG